MRNVSDKIAEKIKTHTLCSETVFFRKSCLLLDNVKNIVGPVSHIAHWISKSTNTESECVTLIAFPLQQSLHQRVSL
jgi:hypothetical protein